MMNNDSLGLRSGVSTDSFGMNNTFSLRGEESAATTATSSSSNSSTAAPYSPLGSSPTLSHPFAPARDSPELFRSSDRSQDVNPDTSSLLASLLSNNSPQPQSQQQPSCPLPLRLPDPLRSRDPDGFSPLWGSSDRQIHLDHSSLLSSSLPRNHDAWQDPFGQQQYSPLLGKSLGNSGLSDQLLNVRSDPPSVNSPKDYTPDLFSSTPPAPAVSVGRLKPSVGSDMYTPTASMPAYSYSPRQNQPQIQFPHSPKSYQDSWRNGTESSNSWKIPASDSDPWMKSMMQQPMPFKYQPPQQPVQQQRALSGSSSLFLSPSPRLFTPTSGSPADSLFGGTNTRLGKKEPFAGDPLRSEPLLQLRPSPSSSSSSPKVQYSVPRKPDATSFGSYPYERYAPPAVSQSFSSSPSPVLHSTALLSSSSPSRPTIAPYEPQQMMFSSQTHPQRGDIQPQPQVLVFSGMNKTRTHAPANRSPSPHHAASPGSSYGSYSPYMSSYDGGYDVSLECVDKAMASSRQKVKQMLKRMKTEKGLSGPEGVNELIAIFRNPNTAANTSGSERWVVLLELADMARREGDFERSRQLYKEVVTLKPKKNQCWLEYAKMEEEAGQLERAKHVLRRGLKHYPLCETLMVKMLKLEEKSGNLVGARTMLARLKDLPLEKTWHTMLEGAMMEARNGNNDEARALFMFLIQNVPWYGPVFQEAYRFEDRCEQFDRAVAVVEQGVRENPKYGPLWFSAFRLFEKVAPEKLPDTFRMACECLMKDIKWKAFFEMAQIYERAKEFDKARALYRSGLECCPSNLEWKVWFGACRTEMYAQNYEAARTNIRISAEKAPPKMAAAVILEHSRMEEYAGCIDAARAVLREAIEGTQQEWKIYLETVLLELRADRQSASKACVREALAVHDGTGRLWAMHIQLLSTPEEADEQLAVFEQATKEVPKSGEVWCEGARLYMRRKRFADARACLQKATMFTPQYGDSFIEFLRLDLVEHGVFTPELASIEMRCMNAEPNYGPMWLYCKHLPTDSPSQVLRQAKSLLLHAKEDPKCEEALCFADVNEMYKATTRLPPGRERLKIIFGADIIKP